MLHYIIIKAADTPAHNCDIGGATSLQGVTAT
jgi:hypothetical protein